MQTWINQNLPLFVVVMVVGTVSFRWLLLNVIAALSGWKVLARRFPAEQPFSGRESKWQSARMRYSMGYNNCLRIGAGPAGISIEPMWGLRTGHSPVCVPWSEVRVGPTSTRMGVSVVTLALGQLEQIPFTVRQSLAARLRADAGPAWPQAGRIE